jgi:hypothetical protein
LFGFIFLVLFVFLFIVQFVTSSLYFPLLSSLLHLLLLYAKVSLIRHCRLRHECAISSLSLTHYTLWQPSNEIPSESEHRSCSPSLCHSWLRNGHSARICRHPYRKRNCKNYSYPWNEINEYFSVAIILPDTLGPGIYSASNRNEYQK